MADVAHIERLGEPSVIPDSAIGGIRELPIAPGKHMWAVGVFYRVNPADAQTPERKHILDSENMLTVTPIRCFNCGMPNTEEFERMECPHNV